MIKRLDIETNGKVIQITYHEVPLTEEIIVTISDQDGSVIELRDDVWEKIRDTIDEMFFDI